ncbi:uncharacterized protein EV420DRAFT_1643860 [Desarmillaria tabescens]|uniref:Uncharacterized protein n=1 Tax=Armillaria tabescens TaxID=1929756 RepID=A0AA39KCV5_ARMTA|nr:uncharacterized protein EV420DRAFT_1643860 [Desarmillaria tabescens]KAK0457526.1 hypothetical protein EV420DRAFT_1643860 [Desarmillaria tabescens]
MPSLWNIQANQLASLNFLYVTGRAEGHIGLVAQKIMFLQDRLPTTYLTGYILVRDGLPIRKRPSTSDQRNPYSPSVPHFAEGSAPILRFNEDHRQQLPSNVLSSAARSSLPFPWNPPADQSHHLPSYYPRLFRVDRSLGLCTSFNDCIRTWTVSTEVLVTLMRKVAECHRAVGGVRWWDDMRPSLTMPGFYCY